MMRYLVFVYEINPYRRQPEVIREYKNYVIAKNVSEAVAATVKNIKLKDGGNYEFRCVGVENLAVYE